MKQVGGAKRYHPSALFAAEASVPEEKLTREALLQRSEKRRGKMGKPVDIPVTGIYYPERSDAQLLDFIGLVVDNNASALRRVATSCLDTSSETVSYWCICLEQTVIAARSRGPPCPLVWSRSGS